MSKQTNNTNATSENTSAMRPTRKQFAVARQLTAANETDIPKAAIHNRRAMGGFIATHLRAAAS